MFYRVDYMLAVLAFGFILGLAAGPGSRQISTSRIAVVYYAAVAALASTRVATYIFSFYGHANFWNSFGGPLGDVSSLVFGMLFGIAVGRDSVRELLTDQHVQSAIRMGLAFGFALAGVGKAFAFGPMTEFFSQSGYSVAFLKFIIAAEIFAAVGLLLPWAWIPALIGLTVDMFGAVLTHAHNGDPLNDSTGAIGSLIRLLTLGMLWAWSCKGEKRPAFLRNPILGVGAAVVACLLVAIGGGAAVRHFGASSATVAAPASK